MDRAFGEAVRDEAASLAAEGKDANQIANILCAKDRAGHNYGIGIILNTNGKPAATSGALRELSLEEINASGEGTYRSSAKVLDALRRAVLAWQRVPERHWDAFVLGLPSDAGTGAVQTAVELGLLMNPAAQSLVFEELGWPAYKAIATAARAPWKTCPTDGVVRERSALPIYQAGPMNTTGVVNETAVVHARAESAAADGLHVVLDRAYPGFELAQKAAAGDFDGAMRASYERFIAPFIDQGVSFSLALSPTKAFVTFALRPCGFLLTYCPDAARRAEVKRLTGAIIRARGSSFEHPITRAFARGFVEARGRFEAEHRAALDRVAAAETAWARHVRGTAMEPLFAGGYAGLFRNPTAKGDAEAAIYGEHLYPVFSAGRCRLNITGLPADETLAKSHVAIFSAHCA